MSSLKINALSTAVAHLDKDVAVPLRGAELFAAGLVNRLLDVNDLPQLETCLKATDGATTKIANVMDHFRVLDINNIIKGVEECIGIVMGLPEELKACKVLGHDGDRITEWAGIFLNPLKLVADITDNIARNISSIIGTGTEMVKFFIDQKWE